MKSDQLDTMSEKTEIKDVKTIAKEIRALLRNKFRKLSAGSESRSSWHDFCSFKIMLFPQIIKFFWFLGLIASTLGGIVQIVLGIANGSWQSAGLGLLVLIFSPIVTHLLLEFILLPFSILEILREIRDSALGE